MSSQGPEFDEEAQSELTVSELRERARKQREELEKRMTGDGSDEEEEKEESEATASESSSSEETGCLWGMGNDENRSLVFNILKAVIQNYLPVLGEVRLCLCSVQLKRQCQKRMKMRRIHLQLSFTRIRKQHTLKILKKPYRASMTEKVLIM